MATSNPLGLRDLSIVNGDRWRAAEIRRSGHGSAIASPASTRPGRRCELDTAVRAALAQT